MININTCNFRKYISLVIICILIIAQVLFCCPPISSAQTVLNLPPPGTMVLQSQEFQPPLMRGMSVFPENPLRFDFLIDEGDATYPKRHIKGEAEKLIKYFLTSLTIPEKDLWVNLSPYESHRMIPSEFGETAMGRDLLAQDYLLKQLAASLIYPEEDFGEKFWERVYQKVHDLYGTLDIPVNTFNKIWIVPDKAKILENGNSAFIEESHLKVMLEEDYLALNRNLNKENFRTIQIKKKKVERLSSISSKIFKDIILPEVEKEVNHGKNFAPLRQVYHSLILAAWYKKRLKESVFGKVYIDKYMTSGVDIEDKKEKQKIYAQYVESIRQGVFDYIREDYDENTDQFLARKYFSGGFGFENIQKAVDVEVITDMPPSRKLEQISSSNLNRRNFLKQAIIALAAMVLSTPGKISAQEEIPPQDSHPFTGTKFVPQDDQKLFFVGQDYNNINNFVDNTGIIPSGFMTYTSIQRVQGFDSPADDGAGVNYAQGLLNEHPDTALQIGLYMVDALDQINSGDYDDNIRLLAQRIKRLNRPVYLRIGYEFDGPWNNFEPEKYKQAYIRIHDILTKEEDVQNVAFVWHSAAISEESGTLDEYYPGEEYVDWVAVTIFNHIPISEQHAISPALLNVVNYARDHQKPLMIAVSAPRYMNSAQEKQMWFERYFQFIQDNADVIRAFSYCNCNWEDFSVFRGQGYGDTRIEIDEGLLQFVEQKLNNEEYNIVLSSPGLYDSIGFIPVQFSDTKFVPQNDQKLFFVGQEYNSIKNFVDNTGITPAGFMTYTSIQYVQGLDSPAYGDAGINAAQALVDEHPDTALQVGLYMVDALDQVISGGYDDNIRLLAQRIKELNRPVYLRIGFEFDGPWNNYDSEKYKQAYIRIHDILTKEEDVDNVAFIWHSAAISEDSGMLEEYYPGEEYVDWVAVSVFNHIPTNEQAAISPALLTVANFARDHRKPLMIAESAPTYMYSTEEKQVWFERYFQFIQDNADVIRAFCYINWNWEDYSVFHGLGYGDSRIELDEVLLELFKQKLEEKDRNIMVSSPNLDDSIGFRLGPDPSQVTSLGALPTARGLNQLSEGKKNLGGIDFDPELIDMAIHGESLNLNFSTQPEELLSMEINGFSPLVYRIEQVTDLQHFILK